MDQINLIDKQSREHSDRREKVRSIRLTAIFQADIRDEHNQTNVQKYKKNKLKGCSQIAKSGPGMLSHSECEFRLRVWFGNALYARLSVISLNEFVWPLSEHVCLPFRL